MCDDRIGPGQCARILPFPTVAVGPTRRRTIVDLAAYRDRSGFASGPPAIGHQPVAHRAPRDIFASKGVPAMNASNLGLSHLFAEARRADFAAEAERERLAARAAAGNDLPGVVAALRMRLGAALIRAGERMHGAADEPRAEIGSLRPARS